ncbi:methyltransferase domain-containing protein [Candidatus Marinimicrobia bacterium MT.SAG.2]|nr:methyltransferase domain-containing protein [Candidatus Marinimicrobia bacterium MT.SAG.2]
MTINYTKIDNCRVCSSNHMDDILSLGIQPLTGVFIKPDQQDPIEAPLDMVICNECKLVQLAHTVNSNLMYENYWYRSGINQTMRDHLAGIVGDINSRVNLQAGDLFIDIGCNDGTLLAALDVEGLIKIGVDPSDAIHSIKDPDIIKINSPFTNDAVENKLQGRKAHVISSISMFYDIQEPHKFVETIVDFLDENGMWVVEMNYTGDMIKNCGYDMISHEHLIYYTMSVFEELIAPHGLFINDVSLNSINGGSIRIYVGPKPGETENVVSLREQEKEQGLDKKETYLQFALQIEVSKKKLKKKIKQIIDAGERIAAYGASTRGNTILLYCGLDHNVILGAAERNPLKYGLVTAGTRIPIKSEDEIRAANPEYFLILPYTFLNEFIERESEYFENGGRFLVPIPDLEIIYKKDGKIIHELVN